MKKEIISLIPSHDLRMAIESYGYEFEDAELAALIYRLVPTHAKCIYGLKRFLSFIQDEKAKKQIQNSIAIEEKSVAEFVKDDKECFYDVIICEKRKSHDFVIKDFPCRNYSGVMRFIKYYTDQYYLHNPKYKIEYEIHKLKFIEFSDKAEFESINDIELEPLCFTSFTDSGELKNIGSMLQDHGKVLCGLNCADCGNCLDFIDIKYPKFLNNHELVIYQQDEKNIKEYGTIFVKSNDFVGEACINPLDLSYYQKREFNKINDEHVHVPFYYVEKAALDKIPKRILENYYQYLEYLKIQK